MGSPVFDYKKFPSLVHAADLIPEGWTVLEDVEPTFDLDMSKWKLRLFLKDDDHIRGWLDPVEMRERAVEFGGNLGLSDGKRMLIEQNKLPEKFKEYFIPLPGTLLRTSDGGVVVPYFFVSKVNFAWHFDWDAGNRFVCRK